MGLTSHVPDGRVHWATRCILFESFTLTTTYIIMCPYNVWALIHRPVTVICVRLHTYFCLYLFTRVAFTTLDVLQFAVVFSPLVPALRMTMFALFCTSWHSRRASALVFAGSSMTLDLALYTALSWYVLYAAMCTTLPLEAVAALFLSEDLVPTSFSTGMRELVWVSMRHAQSIRDIKVCCGCCSCNGQYEMWSSNLFFYIDAMRVVALMHSCPCCCSYDILDSLHRSLISEVPFVWCKLWLWI